nr:anti-sigma factor domain-containing protein [Sporolactobacillus kofuensis]
MINQGVLVSKKGRRAVVLTNDGDFRAVRLRRSVNLSVGQTVLPKHLVQFHLFPHSILTPVIALGLSILCFLPLSHSTYAPPGPVAAYIYFDLKASVEASVNRDMQIISVQPLNDEGVQLLRELPVTQNMSFQKFSTALFSTLRSGEHKKNRSLWLITTVLTDQVSHPQQSLFAHRLVTTFNTGAQELTQANNSGIEWLHTTVERKKDAEARGLSVGKYLLYLKANAYGKTLTIDDARRLSAAQMQQMSTTISLPWSTLIRQNDRIQEHQAPIEKASYKMKYVEPVFQDSSLRDGQIKEQDTSSYLYPASPTAGYA